MEAYDSDSAGSYAGSDKAEVAGAVEAIPGGAEAWEGPIVVKFGPDDTPASPPLVDQGPFLPMSRQLVNALLK